ncbi:hypothetical protein Cni_G07170 [Canna indica]|uniref:Uncharacterized protein n=1 Tax=Canna indica TaxID=4628 RepID=A0AAQ3JZW3_9LILI|nr:hypothetical protein Cni_G07170 [Canna indica]
MHSRKSERCSKICPPTRRSNALRMQLNKSSSTDELATQFVNQHGGAHYEARSDDEDPELEAGIRASLEHAAFKRDQMYYRGSKFEYGGDSGGGGTSSVGSTSTAGAMDRSGSIPSGPHIDRSSSMRAPQSRRGRTIILLLLYDA